MLRSILFDLFGTVIAYGDMDQGNRQAAEAIYTAMRTLNLPASYAQVSAYWDHAFFQPLTTKDRQAPTPFARRILRLFEHLRLSEDSYCGGSVEAAMYVAAQCLASWDTLLYVPADALRTLQALRRHYRLALVSNFDHPLYVHATLERHGMGPCFDTIIISGEVGIDKPDPRIFHLALNALGCTPDEALFVGDTLEADILGAQAVGCRAILIDRAGRYPLYGGERIQTLEELLPILDQSAL